MTGNEIKSKTVYSVGQVNAYIRNMFAQDILLNNLTVKGELSNVKYHTTGHIYFTLKDDKGAISCIMFAGNARSGLKFRMEDGQKVQITGNVDIYERDGKYQLYAKRVQLDGDGDLFLRFEQLKKELSEMGMFDAMYKKPIPKIIRTLGVVTAPTGAAVQDIINIATRRNPYVQIILYPALVQGDGAVSSIVKGIRELEKQNVDVMIVGRGGGSIEDLWAFYEKEVAQAVFDCSVPVISAVGHETDTTIIDFVSDMRAPTPSAAAELAVYEADVIFERLENYENALYHRMQEIIEKVRLKLAYYEKSVVSGAPMWKIREKRTLMMSLEDRLIKAMKDLLKNNYHKRDMYLQKLKGLSPLEKLEKGFAYVQDSNNATLRSVEQLKKGDSFKVYLTDGYVDSLVVNTTKK
ncbi:MAG: exodeoxyribonuclease VII large subunit [Lachnospiraceae bacterium]|nr:exodeoxyribonuclease VII large subunit [Candidatus Merdinaster equi]